MHRKHTIVAKRELKVHPDSVSGKVITYTLSEGELYKYRSLPGPEIKTKPMDITIRKNKINLEQ